MTVNVFFAARASLWNIYRPALTRAFAKAGLDASLSDDPSDPRSVDYLIHAPNGPVTDFTAFTRAKAVLSLWAGVEDVVGNPTLVQPLCRMVDPGLREGMVEWVTGHVLRHHLGMDAHIVNPERAWNRKTPPLARDRNVTILGLGALGAACAETLARMNFRVTGWRRSPKALASSIVCLSGEGGLKKALSSAEILVLLLPLTARTSNLMDANRFALLPEGAIVINPGRGDLIVDEALLEALNSGRILHATLDVFRTEPLPADHPFWCHPRVTVTPHIAAETRPDSAARVIAENIRRGENGLPFLHVVDRTAGY
ncbi:MAG: glyoxylate/hydroxypyruvate reductase A [Pseudomonadota bacterium]